MAAIAMHFNFRYYTVIAVASFLSGGYFGNLRGEWNVALNNGALSIYERDDRAFLNVWWTGTGKTEPPAFALFDADGRQIKSLSTRKETASWKVELPSNKLGYFEVRPLVGDAEKIIPQAGSRPAGRLTFAVVEKRRTRLTQPSFGKAFLSLQGTTLVRNKGGLSDGWDVLPFLGVQAQGADYAWPRYESGGPDNFERMVATDALPIRFKKARLFPYFNLCGVPSWAVDESRLPAKERLAKSTLRLPPKDWKLWETYLTKIVGHIITAYDFVPERIYEIMWEPVSPWGWYGTPDEIVKNFEIAYKVIHKLDPHGLVAGPTLGNLEEVDQFEELMKRGLGKWIDIVSCHPYVKYPPENADIPGKLKRIRELSRLYAGMELPFIGTEFGWTHDAAGSPLNQAIALTASLIIFKGEGASMFTLFYLADFPPDARYGLCYNLVPGTPFGPGKVSPKPALPMVRAAIDQVGETEPVCRLNTLPKDIQGYIFRESTTDIFLAALWDPTGRERTVDFETGNSTVQIVDCYGNNKTRKTVAGSIALRLGRAPIYVRGLSEKTVDSRYKKSNLSEVLSGSSQRLLTSSLNLALRTEDL